MPGPPGKVFRIPEAKRRNEWQSKCARVLQEYSCPASCQFILSRSYEWELSPKRHSMPWCWEHTPSPLSQKIKLMIVYNNIISIIIFVHHTLYWATHYNYMRSNTKNQLCTHYVGTCTLVCSRFLMPLDFCRCFLLRCLYFSIKAPASEKPRNVIQCWMTICKRACPSSVSQLADTMLQYIECNVIIPFHHRDELSQVWKFASFLAVQLSS